MLRRLVLLGVLGWASWGCTTIPTGEVATPTPAFVTATLPPTSIPSATPVPPSPTLEPTATPRPGITSTQLYVRASPDAASQELGLLAAATSVQIYGQDPRGNWYQIAYVGADQHTGWIAAQYVQVVDKDSLPVIEVATVQGPHGTVEQRVNVRSGPGTEFDSIGTLDPGAVITPTGKDSSGAWLQIEYPSGPDKKGWVAADYVQASGLDDLQVLDQSGPVAATAVPGTPASQPTPSPATARPDGDSLTSPSVDAIFSPRGSGSVIYTNDVSGPAGDATDWIGFTPYWATVFMRLSCSGDDQVSTQLLFEGQPVGNWDGLSCGDSAEASLTAGQPYVLAVSPAATDGMPVYVRYTVTIQAWR